MSNAKPRVGFIGLGRFIDIIGLDDILIGGLGHVHLGL